MSRATRGKTGRNGHGRGALRWALAALLAPAAMAWTGASAAGQGFGIYEQGTCAMARGGAAVAEPCPDGSAIFFNPAGLAGMEGVTLTGGTTLIFAQGGFTPDGTGTETELDNDAVPAPHLFATWGIDDRLSVGLGAFVPYGLQTTWPLGFDGRFSGYDNTLQSIYIQPTVAYRVNRFLSVGAGLDLVLSSVEINQRLDLARQPVGSAQLPPGTTFGDLGVPPGTDFADLNLDADQQAGVAWNVGVRLRPHERVTIGLRYLSRAEIEYEGDATFEQVSTGITLPAGNPLGAPPGTPIDAVLAPRFSGGGPLGDQGVSTEITMPDQLVAGVSVAATDRLRFMADAVWTHWSVFDTVTIRFENPATPTDVRPEEYDDTWGVHAGLELDLAPAWTARGGFFANEAAAPDRTVTPLLPEADRAQVTAGLGWAPDGSPVEVNVAYQYLGQEDRRGRTREPAPGQPFTGAALNNGLYQFEAHLVGGTLTLRF